MPKKKTLRHIKKSYPQNVFTNYIFNMYKQDLALNNLQGLICHQIQPTNQPTWRQAGYYWLSIMTWYLYIVFVLSTYLSLFSGFDRCHALARKYGRLKDSCWRRRVQDKVKGKFRYVVTENFIRFIVNVTAFRLTSLKTKQKKCEFFKFIEESSILWQIIAHHQCCRGFSCSDI